MYGKPDTVPFITKKEEEPMDRLLTFSPQRVSVINCYLGEQKSDQITQNTTTVKQKVNCSFPS